MSSVHYCTDLGGSGAKQEVETRQGTHSARLSQAAVWSQERSEPWIVC